MADVVNVSFDEAVDRTQRASALCSKYAYYDPRQLEELRARVNEERGEAIELSCLFNDRRLGADTDAFTPAPSRQALEVAQSESTFRWGEPFATYLDKLMVQVSATSDAVELEVQVDTHHVSADEVPSLMLELESLLVAAVR